MKVKDLKVGDKVSYRAALGFQVEATENHEVTRIEPMPNAFCCDIAWITGKSGCIDIKHLTLM